MEKNTGTASSSFGGPNEEPDYDHLDVSFQDSDDCGKQSCTTPSKDHSDMCKKGYQVSEYILGTLVVRVVAARNLEPVQKGGLGHMVFGGNRSSSSSRNSGGSANPYASVKFGKSTQRTSEVYDSLDPVWPRQETMFMDVSLPTSEVTHAPIQPQSSTTTELSPQSTSAQSTVAGQNGCYTGSYKSPNAVLTVAMFHTPEIGRVHKFPSKDGFTGALSGDSDDLFLGVASVDLTQLLTGRRQCFDEWLPLSGTKSAMGTVRVVCEYEASDPPPRIGDICRFTSFCHPADLFPVMPGRTYRVSQVHGDDVHISYETQEGWVCSFLAHRFMLVCEERHIDPIEIYQDELSSITTRLSHSPMVHTLTETAERVAVDGLLSIGGDVVNGCVSLFGRWFDGGVQTVVHDVTHVTNWDGRSNPDMLESLALPRSQSEEGIDSSEIQVDVGGASSEISSTISVEPLPNMPSCPITGDPMIDPVVAADGHTYERSAIARWLRTSDKSPLTGSILPHKELVPNYGLMSSLQEVASRAKETTDDLD